ncbi:MAG: formate dehydrogenase accessory sulfurtransferase FdhD, partial [Kofleriaceae bacterium]|nr:formate dehydrogenase accessory sulfurtransferase FdhD [Kofleriaceae bacterium]
MKTSERHPRTLWRNGTGVEGVRVLAEETPVAISYNGSTHAVLMATPADLEDLAVGFSVTEGIVRDVDAIEAIEVVAFDLGLDIQVRVREDVAQRLVERRRSMAGPVGCGLCGLESLEAATRQI